MAEEGNVKLPDEATHVRPDGGKQRAAGRFAPGEVLADRFRIVAPLGRGGMGDVYGAEDLRLGQQVALKFLLHQTEGDNDRLARLHAEVRLGRQVSHPNVCRLYDVMEWKGTCFIAMELVDGEDLGSLLRRIGKLPTEKALELAHEICAGLAAVHAAGIVHRDFKPANVMIDGRGHARITDFGLAALESDAGHAGEIAGTPAYMAPEQRLGLAVTPRSDLYALGVVLHEMFTGERLSPGSASSSPRDVDPAVARVIQRCVAEDPNSRPSSIHAVIAGLPGRDPLQAAVDAGQTPSPEMVAAAAVVGEIRPSRAIPLALLALMLFLAAVAVTERTRLHSLLDLEMRPDALEQRARDIIGLAGYERLHYSASIFSADQGYRAMIQALGGAHPDPETIAAARPAPMRFLYHESPREMVPENRYRLAGLLNDPPFVVPGMRRIQLDPDGRLVSFEVVPSFAKGGAASAVDWTPFLRAAGFDPASLQQVAPEWVAAVDNDTKVAWTARLSGRPESTLRIEGAAHRGKIVSFQVIPSWRKPPQGASPAPTPLVRWTNAVTPVLGIFVIVAAVMLAVRNSRRGRADKAAAVRLGIWSFFLILGGWFLRSIHSGNLALEFELFQEGAGVAAYSAAFAAIFYMAVEPYLRRRWPRTLVGWSRMISGRAGDPLVGRELLIGMLIGSGMSLLEGVLDLVVGVPYAPAPATMTNFRLTGTHVLENLQGGAANALWVPALLLLVHAVLRNRSAAIAVTVVVIAVFINTPGVSVPVEIAAKIALSGMLVWGLVHSGVLTTAVALFCWGLVRNFPVTLDTSSWFFAPALIYLAPFFFFIAYGCYRSIGAQPLFPAAVLED